MKYILILIIVFNVYFYFDIVSRYTLSNGLLRFLSKIIKAIDFKELLRKFYNFIRSNISHEKAKELLLKFYNFIIFKLRKR